ncbi:MAG: YXWGXW repeat-containing protein [Variovorax sp.]
MKKLVVAAGVAGFLAIGTFAVPTVVQAQPVINVQIGTPPPPPRVERVPPPRAGYVWAPGHWEPRGNRYVWASGAWVRARPGYAYNAPQWHEQDGRWEYRRGEWDRDHDGVPNRHDRHPNNSHRN